MLFSSITFLYYFLPIVLVLYFLVPTKVKNYVLLLASLIFYAWGEPKYVFLMILSVGIGYAAGLILDRLPGSATVVDAEVKDSTQRKTGWGRKAVLVVSVGLCLFFLVYFKYTNFFISNVNSLLKTQLPALNVIMPIGISFYTFQIISYIVDVYRGEVESQKNFFHLATYISMFPQLIAGPIVRYTTINEELKERRITGDNLAEGIKRFVLGLGKKVLIANQLGELCSVFQNSDEKTFLFYWLYAVATMLHIYFDFSGYSDMAIGLGRMFGFTFLENFNYPFMSKSVTEFWRRWHMSLGTWFRDYVYIPLGGNRVSKGRYIFNIFSVWFLTGFWHGAEWNFIIWGVFFGVFLLIEKFWLLKKLKTAKIWNRIYIFLLIAVSFVIFNAGNTAQMLADVGGLFGVGSVTGAGLAGAEFLYYLKSYVWILLIAAVGATDLPKRLYGKLREKQMVAKLLAVAEPVALVFLLLVCTAYLIDGSFNPFLYFRF